MGLRFLSENTEFKASSKNPEFKKCVWHGFFQGSAFYYDNNRLNINISQLWTQAYATFKPNKFHNRTLKSKQLFCPRTKSHIWSGICHFYSNNKIGYNPDKNTEISVISWRTGHRPGSQRPPFSLSSCEKKMNARVSLVATQFISGDQRLPRREHKLLQQGRRTDPWKARVFVPTMQTHSWLVSFN